MVFAKLNKADMFPCYMAMLFPAMISNGLAALFQPDSLFNESVNEQGETIDTLNNLYPLWHIGLVLGSVLFAGCVTALATSLYKGYQISKNNERLEESKGLNNHTQNF